MTVIQSHTAQSNNLRAHWSGIKVGGKWASVIYVIYIIYVGKARYWSSSISAFTSQTRTAAAGVLDFVANWAWACRKRVGKGRGRGKKWGGEELVSRELSGTWPWCAGKAAAAAHRRCTAPLRAVDKKQLNFHRHTPICVIYLPLFLSLSVSLAFSSLLSHSLSFISSHPSSTLTYPYLMSSFTEPHTHIHIYICSHNLFYFPVMLPIHTHAAFVTMPDKQHPASRPQVQVVIALSLKWRLLS